MFTPVTDSFFEMTPVVDCQVKLVLPDIFVFDILGIAKALYPEYSHLRQVWFLLNAQ